MARPPAIRPRGSKPLASVVNKPKPLSPREKYENLVLDHLHLVDVIARRIQERGRFGCGLPQTVDLDDMIQAGRLGLMEAARRFNPTLGYEFAAYANPRIHGAIIDAFKGRRYTAETCERIPETEANVKPTGKRQNDSEDQASGHQLRKHLNRGLADLDSQERHVLLGNVIDGYSLAEVGAMHRRGPTWAYYKSNCAKAKMRVSLERLGIGADG